MPMVDTRIQLFRPAPDYTLRWEDSLDLAWRNSTAMEGDVLQYPQLYLRRKQGAGDAPKNIIHLGQSQAVEAEYTWKTGGEMFIPQGGPGYYFELVWVEKDNPNMATAIGNYFTIMRFTPTTTESTTSTPSPETTTAFKTETADGSKITGEPDPPPGPIISSPNSDAANPATNPKEDSSRLSQTAKIAIGASIGVAFLCIFLALLFFLKYRRQKKSLPSSSEKKDFELATGDAQVVPKWLNGVPTELSSPLSHAPPYSGYPTTPTELQSAVEHRELAAGEVRPRVVSEMPAGGLVHEMDANQTRTVKMDVYGKVVPA